jgi:protein-S-isoprenylcysteine O-methyltransferase Ste14
VPFGKTEFVFLNRMVRLGNFFFKYRNWIFILLYAALLVPSPPLITYKNFGERYYIFPILAGLLVTFFGEIFRGITIGLVYIIRGGRDGKPFAEGLVTEGMFNHCRNPLYFGNICMLAGLGILANSLLYIVIMVPLFIFIYQAIVLAEEGFLEKKFGEAYTAYCKKTNRWFPDLRGIGRTFASHRFSWRRWIVKEHTTQFIWLCGIAIILLLKYPQLTGGNSQTRNILLGLILLFFLILYLFIRYLKAEGKLETD